uniref:NADH-ubiquinone oxidoreductase chain 2 n=1 Tax=Coleoptera sp. ACP-2013 TaxID=2485033 RepID=A0A3G3MEG8_9COLE|nr:NADH dehydrogenase subunit 2 [Coleoptera sp. ACP-2013]
MYKLYKILFFNFMILSTLITISAYTWFSMWLGLEINLLSFIPLMKSQNNKFPAEASLKYFIVQALASTMILFVIILSLNYLDYLPSNLNLEYLMIMNSALLMKMGAAPFHAWFPEVIEGLGWMNSLILLTWQKLGPMILIMYNFEMNNFFSYIIIFSSIIGSFLGLNQVSLRKILAYSSINHIAWLLSSMFYFKMMWMNYFLIYSMILCNIITIMYLLNIFYLNQLIMTINYSKLIKLFFMLNFLSLAGLPPFLGFMPKWLVINSLIENNFLILSIILILSTLITLYFYLRITMSSLTISKEELLIKVEKINYFFITWLNFLSLAGLLFCTSIFLIL